ncbi:hypothetical protein T07_7165 [Trichinella nelsoni]|uniref:Uncharacterized protein n=1 Tax=Trichinella nelsoni TaxID=6336 RepID=A0A0V0SHU6_9BILA|nr:hypothetical protein T07_7165 [Trichinella nelsoni]
MCNGSQGEAPPIDKGETQLNSDWLERYRTEKAEVSVLGACARFSVRIVLIGVGVPLFVEQQTFPLSIMSRSDDGGSPVCKRGITLARMTAVKNKLQRSQRPSVPSVKPTTRSD